MGNIIKVALAVTFMFACTTLTNAQANQDINDLKEKAVSRAVADQPGAKAKPITATERAAEQKADASEEQADKAASAAPQAASSAATGDSISDEMLADAGEAGESSIESSLSSSSSNGGFHQALKTKFIEGNAGFMSLVALALVLGLAFCIERIIYLSLSEINAKSFMAKLSQRIQNGEIEDAKQLAASTRGPVAALCAQGLSRINETIENIERGVTSYGSVQASNLEKGCSWITLFIAMAPSLGFLGTVIGMVMAFDQIQQAGDISPTIVAAGMKVALITTIFGIIVALILQVFYNYILSKIEHITAQMEESVITLLDAINEYKEKQA